LTGALLAGLAGFAVIYRHNPTHSCGIPDHEEQALSNFDELLWGESAHPHASLIFRHLLGGVFILV
jgi:hypothetical protein